jgi:hypothetical protein
MFRRIAWPTGRHTPSPPHHPVPRLARSALARIASTLGAVAVAIVLVTPAAAAAQGPVEDTTAPIETAGAVVGPVNSANARFVVDAYQHLLGRDPDTAGLDYYLARLTSGGDTTRRWLTEALALSTEGRRQTVAGTYLDLLDRQPDPDGLAYWTDRLVFVDLLDLRVLILAGDEYRNRAGGTDEAWVEALYADVLGRPSDPSGKAYWVDQAQRGTARALIVAAVYQGDESLRRRVNAYYDEVLLRAPTGEEQTEGMAAIRTDGERKLQARLLASDEAFEPHLQAALS